MTKQQVGGNGATSPVPTADRSRNVLQNVENLYDLELANRVFEDGSISGNKLTGMESVYVENLGTADVTVGNLLQSDGDGTVSFATPIVPNVESLGTADMTVGNLLQSDGDGTVSFATPIVPNVESLGTADMTVGNLLQSDGDGTVSFVTPSGGSSPLAYSGLSLYSTNAAPPTAEPVTKGTIQIGYGTFVGFDQSMAIGSECQSYGGKSAIAIGYNTTASAYESTAFGTSCDSTAIHALSMGYVCKAYGYGSLAVGSQCDAVGIKSIAIGDSAKVLTGHDQSVSIGQGVLSTAADQFNIGVSNTSKITFDTWVGTIAAAAPSTHKIPVLLGGVRYNLLATTA